MQDCGLTIADCEKRGDESETDLGPRRKVLFGTPRHTAWRASSPEQGTKWKLGV